MKEKEVELSGLQKLWAPWRMEYIKRINVGKEGNCIFCSKPDAHEDEKNYILYRGRNCYIILNIFPYNNGHLMIVPYKHTSQLADLKPETRLELMDLAQTAIDAIKSNMRPDGFNLGVNFGRTAGAGIAEHIHMHLVPRWNGDTNFMPVIGCTKVISESLGDTFTKLKKAMDSINMK